MSASTAMPPLLVLSQNNMLLEFTCATLATGGFRALHVLGGSRPKAFSLSRHVRSFTPVSPAPGDDTALLGQITRVAAATGARVLLPVAGPDVGFVSRNAGRNIWPSPRCQSKVSGSKSPTNSVSCVR